MVTRRRLLLLAAFNALLGAWIVWNMINWPADAITSAAATGLGLFLVAPLFVLSTGVTLFSAMRTPNEPGALGCALILPVIFGLISLLDWIVSLASRF